MTGFRKHDPVVLSGAGERGSAFRTRAADGRETVCTVIDFEPAQGRASYARLAQGSNICLVDVICTEPAGGGTDVSVRYTLTPLSTDGATFVENFLGARRYAAIIEEWRAATTAALTRTGSP